MGEVVSLKIPSPADVPTMTAVELIERVREREGRVLRMRQPPSVFVLTSNPELANWLFARGGTTFTARGLRLNGSYKRARHGTDEWDIWIHPVPVLGEQTLWGSSGEMNIGEVTIQRSGARQAAAEYARTAREMPEGQQRREFEDIARAYRMAAKEDKPIISLTRTIVEGGLRQGTVVHGKGRDWERRDQYLLPRLAVCKADAAFCYTLGVQSNGALELIDSLHRRDDYRKGRITFPGGTFPEPQGYTQGSNLVGTWTSTAWTAMVPIVPPKHRPAKSTTLASYLVLWEVDDWRWHAVPRPPGDPALLKHLAGDLYLVLATWDLTELEQLVLSGRRP